MSPAEQSVAPQSPSSSLTPLPQSDLLLMATTTAFTAASLYYCQPLLRELASSFGRSEQDIANVPMLTQFGYALGLVLFVPLGDLLERRALVCRLLVATALATLGAALAPSYHALMVCSWLIGILAAVTQVIVPMTASLSPPSDRGRAVGIVFSGLLIGVLAARTIAGVVGGYFGWRVVYVGASAALALMAVVLRFRLPSSRAASPPSYRLLMKSVLNFALHSAPLREAAVYGGCAFAAMSAFWTTLVFFLARPPYNFGAKMAGILALAGIAGAAIAPMAGRSADRRGPRGVIGLGLILGCFSFFLLYYAGHHMVGLVVGIVLMDLAVQAVHVSNEAAIYNAVPDATSRANTVYMVSYFLGGALGTGVGSWAWGRAGWFGVCGVGVLFFAIALVEYFTKRPAQ